MSSAIKLFQGRFGRVALLDMDAPLVAHAHHHCHILIKAGGCDGAFRVRGEKAPLTDDSVVLVNAWEPHAYEHQAPPGERTVILALYIEPTWLADVQRSLAMSGHPRFFPKTCVQITPRTRKLTEEFVMELWWADEVSINRLESLLFDLIMTVIEGCTGWRDLVSMLRSRPPVAMDPRVRRSIAMMKSDLSLSMDMDQIAAEIGLSRSHFFSLFQRDTQVTPLVYANVLRFESAIDQLSKTNRSVGEVADSLGFAVPGHFARFFRQHLGITPTEYRRVVNLYEPTSQASVAAAI